VIRTASALSERHMGKTVTIGAVSGELISVHTCRGRTDVELIVGGHRAVFSLGPETEVEVSSA
jgi:hypothetical protein